MDKRPQNMLGSILQQSQIIRDEDVQRALEKQRETGMRFGEALIELGIVSDEDISWGLANQFDMPFLKIDPESVDPDAVKLIPEALARRHTMLPYLLVKDELTVVLDDPTNQKAVSEAGAITGKTINIALAMTEDIEETLDAVYGARRFEADADEIVSEFYTAEEIEKAMEDPTYRRFIDSLLEKSVAQRAMSLGFEPAGHETIVRFRVGGSYIEAAVISNSLYVVTLNALETLMESTRETAVGKEGYYQFSGTSASRIFAVSIAQTREGRAATIRNTWPPGLPESFNEIEDEPEEIDKLREMLEHNRGVLFLAGGTYLAGHGFAGLIMKSLDAACKKTAVIGPAPWPRDQRVLTFPTPLAKEDRFAQMMSAAVNQDPNLIYIQDASDKKVLNMALRAGLEGRFVIANLPFPNVWTALRYVGEQAQSLTMAKAAMVGAVSGVVFERLCDKCKTPVEDLHHAASVLGVDHMSLQSARIYESRPCAKTDHSDLYSPIFIFEALPPGGFSDELLEGAQPMETIRGNAAEVGMTDLIAKARRLVMKGEIGLQEFATFAAR